MGGEWSRGGNRGHERRHDHRAAREHQRRIHPHRCDIGRRPNMATTKRSRSIVSASHSVPDTASTMIETALTSGTLSSGTASRRQAGHQQRNGPQVAGRRRHGRHHAGEHDPDRERQRPHEHRMARCARARRQQRADTHDEPARQRADGQQHQEQAIGMRVPRVIHGASHPQQPCRADHRSRDGGDPSSAQMTSRIQRQMPIKPAHWLRAS